MNGEPLNEAVRQHEAAMRPLADWKFYTDFPQRILNNLGNRPINTDDLSMQAQLYWVTKRLLGEVDHLRNQLWECREEVTDLEEQLADSPE